MINTAFKRSSAKTLSTSFSDARPSVRANPFGCCSSCHKQSSFASLSMGARTSASFPDCISTEPSLFTVYVHPNFSLYQSARLTGSFTPNVTILIWYSMTNYYFDFLSLTLIIRQGSFSGLQTGDRAFQSNCHRHRSVLQWMLIRFDARSVSSSHLCLQTTLSVPFHRSTLHHDPRLQVVWDYLYHPY